MDASADAPADARRGPRRRRGSGPCRARGRRLRLQRHALRRFGRPAAPGRRGGGRHQRAHIAPCRARCRRGVQRKTCLHRETARDHRGRGAFGRGCGRPCAGHWHRRFQLPQAPGARARPRDPPARPNRGGSGDPDGVLRTDGAGRDAAVEAPARGWRRRAPGSRLSPHRPGALAARRRVCLRGRAHRIRTDRGRRGEALARAQRRRIDAELFLILRGAR